MGKLVSIILPVYNGEKYLKESIESVLEQTYERWELLILDDCSTDHTADISKEYVSRDSRIKYFRNEKNLRLPGNLNRGFSLAKGDYLTWTSDDNRYKPDALRAMAEALENNPEASFVFASCRVIDAAGEATEYMMVSNSSVKRLIGENTVGACFLYTRNVYETIGDYDPEYALVEDFDYWQRTASRFQLIWIPEILYEYRLHGDALTNTMNKEKFYRTLEKVLLKNRAGFGKTDLEGCYIYYRGLNNCRVQLQSENPYHSRYLLLKALYSVMIRGPRKVRRVITKVFT